MNQNSVESVGKTLQSAYDEQYNDDKSVWRELCAKHKAINIHQVCKTRTFSKVLDCGAGEGSVLQFLDNDNICQELYAIEISESGIAQINKRKLSKLQEAKKFDGYEIPYSDQYFNLAYCSHVLEHVEHTRLLLRELRRVSEYQCFEVPLDYSVNVDQYVKHFLGTGHINIFTPSLFKFLLKTEGFEIIEEHLTHMPQEVLRFNWYTNFGMKQTLLTDLKLNTMPLRHAVKRLLFGKKRHEEYGFAAYTCLTKGVGELKIL